MSTFNLAHVREQGVDLIIIPLSASFGARSSASQNAARAALQAAARSAGLAGTVVPVWDGGGGRMAFLAPPGYHPFFRSIGLSQIYASINRRLTCNL